MALLFAWIGAASASLLCLVIDRTLDGEKVGSVHSRCVCGRDLKIFEVFPVLSWIALRGKARCCKAPLPVRWPIEELSVGVAFYIGAQRSPAIGVEWSLAGLAVMGIVEIVAQTRERRAARAARGAEELDGALEQSESLS